MKETFVVCPTCGAVSVVGGPCEYCGTQLVASEDSVTYEERIIPKRTINPVAFAQKVSVFKNVGEYIFNCAVVNMGGVSGMINLNGDFIFPLEFGSIKLYSSGIAYMQKESDRYLFDLVRWKRITGVTLYSFRCSARIPYEVERKFYDDDCKYYIIHLTYRDIYDNSWDFHDVLLDENANLIAKNTRRFSTVKTGLIIDDRTYFDFKTQHLYHIPDESNVFFDKDEETPPSLVINGSILNTEGKTKEEIQNQINEAVRLRKPVPGSSNSGSDSSSLGSYIGPILIIIGILLIMWMTGAFEN